MYLEQILLNDRAGTLFVWKIIYEYKVVTTPEGRRPHCFREAAANFIRFRITMYQHLAPPSAPDQPHQYTLLTRKIS